MLAPAAPAAAANGCDAPGDTAAVQQYCDSLPTADGGTDVTQHHAHPLAAVLPPATVKQLRHAGALGAAVLALPSGVAPMAKRASVHQRKAIKSLVKGLLPGPGARARAVVEAAGGGGRVDAGFQWALALTLIAVSGLSVWRSAFRLSEH
jgi:hypothetical protein